MAIVGGETDCAMGHERSSSQKRAPRSAKQTEEADRQELAGNPKRASQKMARELKRISLWSVLLVPQGDDWVNPRCTAGWYVACAKGHDR